MSFLGKFLLAVSFVTALPVGKRTSSAIDDLSGLSAYLSLVGLLVGGIVGGLWTVLSMLAAPAILTAALLAVSFVCITGAIHLDGLMDAADGLFSCRTRERMLEIMHDSRVGNFGALAGFCALLLRFASLAGMPFSFESACTLAIVPAWSRAAEVLTIGCFPYARESGMGKVWHDTTGKKDILVALLVPALASICLWFVSGEPLACLCGLVTVIVGVGTAFAINRKLQGHTGDTYGAVVEVAEISGMVSLAMFLRY